MPEPDQVVDTLKLSAERYEQLLARVNNQGVPPSGNKRCEPRLSLSTDTLMVCRIVKTNTDDGVYFTVRPRDVSRWGVGFFHGQYLHPGSRCQVTFIVNREHGVRHEGRVVNCYHISGQVHQVGLHFDEPLALDQLELST